MPADVEDPRSRRWTRGGAQTLRTRLWPWLLLAAVLLAGAVVFTGTLAGMTSLAGYLVFLGTCIRGLGRLFRDDPDRLAPVVRQDGIMGLMAIEPMDAKRRRAERAR